MKLQCPHCNKKLEVLEDQLRDAAAEEAEFVGIECPRCQAQIPLGTPRIRFRCRNRDCGHWLEFDGGPEPGQRLACPECCRTSPVPLLSTGSQWYYRRNRHRVGPFTSEELCELIHQSVINETTMIWYDKQPGWQPVNTTCVFCGAKLELDKDQLAQAQVDGLAVFIADCPICHHEVPVPLRVPLDRIVDTAKASAELAKTTRADAKTADPDPGDPADVFTFDCPACDAVLQAQETAQGLPSRCPGCQEIIAIPPCRIESEPESPDSARILIPGLRPGDTYRIRPPRQH